MIAPGINIYSGTRGLGGALTNPTCLSRKKGSINRDYPISFRRSAAVYPDAEAVYRSYSSSCKSFQDNLVLCTEIIYWKLKAYPALVSSIKENGGTRWLKKCKHVTYARSSSFSRWEGEGDDSPFICCLIWAYQKIIKENRNLK